MKILVIGMGRCGGRIADEFSRQNIRAKRERGLEIVNDVFAVSTDTSDLVDLVSIKADYRHRILIGARQLKGAGVAGDNKVGAQVMQEHADPVIEDIRRTRQFFDTDAILVIAGAAGGIGSGALPVMVQRLKQRFKEKVVYAMVILPYKSEEQEEANTVRNTAVCLKSVASVADAVFLVDNEGFNTNTEQGDYTRTNEAIIGPFYNLLCAGAEKNKKHIGAKIMDAGDIIQTLGGWTLVGSGRVTIPTGLGAIFSSGSGKSGTKENKGIRAIDTAIGGLTRFCKPGDAASALYLITAPAREINLGLIKELGDYLKSAAPNAVIRSGDYPAGSGYIEVTVILSRLSDVARVRDFYSRAATPGVERESSTMPDITPTDDGDEPSAT